MAIYRLSAQLVKRADGRSATAAAAYRAGCVVPDARTGLVFDYTRRGGVVYAEILAPVDTPTWMLDRPTLWNAVEAAERRRDAQLAREIAFALPHELPASGRLDLIKDFVRREFVARGMIADLTVHRPDRGADRRNHHAHVMLTLRAITAEGFGPKARDWNDSALLEHWRAAWSAAVNDALAAHGSAARVDHRSYHARGLPLEPEPKMGPVATEMERRGRVSNAGLDRRAARDRNRELEKLTAKLALVSAELETLDVAESVDEIAPPVPLMLDTEPEKRPKTGRPAAGQRRYLFALWTTAARAVSLPLRALLSAPRMLFRPRREPAAGE